MEFTTKQVMVAIVAAWQGYTLESVLYAARMENEVPKKRLDKLAKMGADLYAHLMEKELELVSTRYPRRRDVRWF